MPDTIYYQEREAEIYDLEYAWKTDDVEFWKALAHEYAGTDGQVLELACGTGRLLFPVAESGVHITGLDQSPWMLDRARKRFESAPADVKARLALHQGDMRSFDLGRKFNLIYVPFNSFLILTEVADQLAVLSAARRHLAPGGVFALDIFVPDINRLVTPVGPPTWGHELEQVGADGLRLQRDIVREVDPRKQVLKVTWRMKEYRDSILTREWLSDLVMTYIFPRELEHLVARAGLEFVNYWGDYDRRDFWTMKDPGKQLAVLKAA